MLFKYVFFFVLSEMFTCHYQGYLRHLDWVRLRKMLELRRLALNCCNFLCVENLENTSEILKYKMLSFLKHLWLYGI